MAIKTYLVDGKKFYEVYLNRTYSGNRFQRRIRHIDNIRKAEKIHFELERELALLREDGVALRWGEWFEKAISRIKMEYRLSTVHLYKMYLGKWVNPVWNEKPLKEIVREDVYHIVHELFPAHFTPHSRRTLLKCIKRMLQMAVEEGHLDRNVAVGIRVHVPEVEQKVFTNEEVKIFLHQAKVTNHRFYPIWVMALMTGMRSGEMFALKWTDIDLEAGTISVSKSWNSLNGVTSTKCGKTRIVPISNELQGFLKELKLSSDGDSVLPILREWEQGLQAMVTRDFCSVIGIKEIKFHDLRATFITNLLARGESLARVMSIVGHTQLKTTNGYLRKAGVEVKGGTDKLGYGIPSVEEANILQFTK